MNNSYLWYVLFASLLICYLIIQFTVKNKKRYFLYFVFGALFGFYFDIVSFTNGYYSCPPFYAITIFGLPLSMTIAEGFAVVITFRLYEFFKKMFNLKKFLNK